MLIWESLDISWRKLVLEARLGSAYCCAKLLPVKLNYNLKMEPRGLMESILAPTNIVNFFMLELNPLKSVAALL